MARTKTVTPTLEPAASMHRHLVCWRSIFAGILISIMTFLIFTALGAGIVGSAAQSVIENEKGALGLLSGAGLWLGLSTVIALFTGSYFAMRMSGFITNKVGIANGFVISSVFFIVLLAEAGSAVGALSQGLGKAMKGAAQGTASLAANPQVQDAVHDAFGTSNLKSPPNEVMQGLVARLMQGDTDSARKYLAYQAGISDTDAQAKIAELKTRFEATAKVAGEKAAAAVADTGWSLLMTFAVGLLAAIVGGCVGAESNVKSPLAEPEPGQGHYVTPVTV